jgi:hypothetical protein
MKQPNPNEFLVLPFVNQDLIAIFRGSDISRPLYVSYSNFVKAITATITPSNALLLQTNSVNNPTQSLLNLIQGTGITITDDGSGGITISNTGSGGTYTADNGLTENPSGNFQLGSTIAGGAPLLHDTYIDTLTDKTLFLEGQKTNLLEYILNVSNTANDGNAILASALGLGTAIRATSILASALSANSTAAPAIAATTGGANEAGLFTNSDTGTNNIVQGIKLRHSSSGVPASGFGIAADFTGKTTLNSDLRLGRLIFQWTNAVTSSRTSKFQVETVNSGSASVKAEILGNGQAILNNYGSGTFTGTAAYNLAVDVNGNIIEATPSGGSGTVTSVDLSMPSAFSVSGNPITTSGTLAVTGAGTTSEYIRGDGSLATFPSIPTIVPNQNESTGILYGGDLSATIGGTTFNLAEGIGQIVSQTSSISGVSTTITPVTWSTSTGIAITNIATHQFTYILIDSSGTIVQQTTPFTDAQAKTHIMIGVLCHIDLASVNLVTNTQNVAYQDPFRLFELIKSFGVIKKSGLTISANGTNLSVDRALGQVFKIGTNYITDEFQPDVTTMTAKILSNLCRVYRNGSGGFVFDTNSGTYYTVIDPNNYDNGSGTLQSVGGSKWSIQRLFIFPNNPDDIICYYGIESYSTFAKARENLEIEVFDEATITQENAVFLGYLFVKNGATDLSDTTQALFLQSGSFRGIGVGGGGGGTSLSLETNSNPNLNQTLLNLVEGANTVITDDGIGNVTIDSDTSRVLILSQDASSSATIEFVDLFTADYTRYEVEIDDAFPQVAGAIKMEIGTGSTPTWQTGGTAYGWLSNRILNTGTGTSPLTFNQTDGQDSAMTLLLNFANLAVENSFSGTIVIYNPLQDFAYHQFTFLLSETQNPVQQLYSGKGTYWATTPVTSIRFYSATGNLLRGNFRLYGYK